MTNTKKWITRTATALLSLSLLLTISCDDGDDDSGSNKSSVTTGVCVGDSITRGLGVSTPYPAVLSGITGKSFANLGRDGATSSDGLGSIGSALSRKPSHVLIMYGINDVIQAVDSDAIAANIIAIADRVKASGATPVIGELTPLTGKFSSKNRFVTGVNGLIRSAASAKGYAMAGTHGAVGGNMQDDIHPDQNGINAIAGAFDKAF